MKKIMFIVTMGMVLLLGFSTQVKADCYFEGEFSEHQVFAFTMGELTQVEPADTVHMDWGVIVVLIGSDVFTWTGIQHAYNYSPHAGPGPEMNIVRGLEGQVIHLLDINPGDGVGFVGAANHEGHTDSVAGVVSYLGENTYDVYAFASHTPEPATIISSLLGLAGFALKKFRG